MSNLCSDKAKSTASTKMAKISGTSKNYEHPEDAAKRMCSGGSIGLGSAKSPYDKD
jgi:hypothetical protein